MGDEQHALPARLGNDRLERGHHPRLEIGKSLAREEARLVVRRTVHRVKELHLEMGGRDLRDVAGPDLLHGRDLDQWNVTGSEHDARSLDRARKAGAEGTVECEAVEGLPHGLGLAASARRERHQAAIRRPSSVLGDVGRLGVAHQVDAPAIRPGPLGAHPVPVIVQTRAAGCHPGGLAQQPDDDARG
jgi:hypothetical protein